ncbi:MAG: hypothetical protein J6X55_16010 [Victivallales bacterium]|nr:hypothetical protein [Victivallales bacterium]
MKNQNKGLGDESKTFGFRRTISRRLSTDNFQTASDGRQFVSPTTTE